jgi:hypothetical protein
MSLPNINPFSFQTEAEVWGWGRWNQGGTIAIQDKNINVRIELSAALFDLVAILILAAQRAGKDASLIHASFLTVEELRGEITQHAGGTMSIPLADPEHVIKAIYRLRKRIRKALFPKEAAERYDKQLVQKTNLGYRLSTAPEKLHLWFLDGQRLEPYGPGEPDDPARASSP